MSERIEYVCNNKSDCHHCHFLAEIKYGNSIVVCDEVLTGPNMIYDLEQENAKLKAELEKSQCMLAGFMVAEDQEKARLKERVALLEKVRGAAEGYSIPGVTHKLNEALDIAKRIEWVLADGSMILPKSGLHTLLKEALKSCEASDE